MKKSYLYLTIIVLLTIVSCGKGEGGIEEPEENKAPSTPSKVYPLNNTLCINNNIIFEWNASTDAEGNKITYKIEISENSSFTPILKTETSASASKLITLPKGSSFYWRIKAIDSQSAASAYSVVSQFLTEGDGVSNHLPFAPTLVAPELNSAIDGTSVTLSWTASDIDGDTLTYDVYLDTNEDPTTLVSENQSGITFDATNLTAASTYYFKVVVKDNKGGSSVGQVWSFTTK